MKMHLFGMMAVLLAGCVADVEDDLGTVGVALTATDARGSTYRLPADTRLVMYGGAFYDEFSLDGDVPFVRITVPAGDYSAELTNGAGYTTQWPLERTAVDGTVETVTAVLTTPMPAPVTITENGQTNLVVNFALPDVGLVTFAEGSVDVSISVSDSTATVSGTSFSSTFDVTSVFSDPTTPPQLPPRLPVVGATGIGMNVDAQITGPWAKTSASSACAPVTLGVATATQPGLADLLTESSGQNAQLCVYGGAGGDVAEIFFYRVGTVTPSTPTFAEFGSQNWLFMTFVDVQLAAPVFDGHTLDLQPLVGTHTLPSTGFSRASVRPTGATTRTTWYRASVTGTTTLTVTATTP